MWTTASSTPYLKNLSLNGNEPIKKTKTVTLVLSHTRVFKNDWFFSPTVLKILYMCLSCVLYFRGGEQESWLPDSVLALQQAGDQSGAYPASHPMTVGLRLHHHPELDVVFLVKCQEDIKLWGQKTSPNPMYHMPTATIASSLLNWQLDIWNDCYSCIFCLDRKAG